MCQRIPYPGYNFETYTIMQWLESDPFCKPKITERAKWCVSEYPNPTMATLNLANEIKILVTDTWNDFGQDPCAYYDLLAKSFQAVDWQQIAGDWIEGIAKGHETQKRASA